MRESRVRSRRQKTIRAGLMLRLCVCACASLVPGACVRSHVPPLADRLNDDAIATDAVGRSELRLSRADRQAARCTASCHGKICGASDGCGGTCAGTCSGWAYCDSSHTCVCGPAPHYMMSGGTCLPSCGVYLSAKELTSGGLGCCSTPCFGKGGGPGSAYDCPYCCENSPPNTGCR